MAWLNNHNLKKKKSYYNNCQRALWVFCAIIWKLTNCNAFWDFMRTLDIIQYTVGYDYRMAFLLKKTSLRHVRKKANIFKILQMYSEYEGQ